MCQTAKFRRFGIFDGLYDNFNILQKNNMHKNDCFEQKNLNKLDKYDIIDITNDIHKKYL